MPLSRLPEWKRDAIEQSRKELFRKLEHAKQQESDRLILERVKWYEERTDNILTNK